MDFGFGRYESIYALETGRNSVFKRISNFGQFRIIIIIIIRSKSGVCGDRNGLLGPELELELLLVAGCFVIGVELVVQ